MGNIEQSKKDILHATKSHMNTVIGLRIPIVIKYQSKSARMCHTKIAMTYQRKSASKNPGKIVKIIQDKNAKMSIQRSQDRWPNKYPSEYAVIAGNYITQPSFDGSGVFDVRSDGDEHDPEDDVETIAFGQQEEKIDPGLFSQQTEDTISIIKKGNANVANKEDDVVGFVFSDK